MVLPVVLAVTAGAGAAYAVAQARATGAQSIGPIATFGAQAQPMTGTAQAGPLTYSYTLSSDQSVKTFVVRNTGSLTQTAQSWTITLTNTGSGTKGDATITACPTPFDATGLCTGLLPLPVPTTVGTVNNSSTSPVNTFTYTTNFTLAPNAVFYARFTPNRIRVYDIAFTMTVSRAQTTPGARTTSS